MNSEMQLRLLDAVRGCLRPLARILLRAGISYRQFEEIAKVAFIQEALGEPDQEGKLTNVSRVSVKTGLSRKEVSRVRDALLEPGSARARKITEPFNSGHAARVLQLWHTDRRFLDGERRAVDLWFDKGPKSFSDLVKLVGGDIPPGAVRAELLAAGSIAEQADGRLRALKRYYIPSDVGKELLVGFRHLVRPVLEGLVHNASAYEREPYFQRITFSDSLPPARAAIFRSLARAKSEGFVQSIDEWLSANETSPAENQHAQGQTTVGVGVFYYEGPSLSGQDER